MPRVSSLICSRLRRAFSNQNLLQLFVTKWDNSQNGSFTGGWSSTWCCWEAAVRPVPAWRVPVVSYNSCAMSGSQTLNGDDNFWFCGVKTVSRNRAFSFIHLALSSYCLLNSVLSHYTCHFTIYIHALIDLHWPFHSELHTLNHYV